MTELTKAVLFKLKDGPKAGKGKPPNVATDGAPVTVQFNPTSLRIQRQNNIDKGGSTTRSQVRQNPSQQSATLTLDLEFDTAEGDANGQPVDVRVRTLDIRQFVEPNKATPASPPPRVLFLWGTFTFAGIITSLTEDLDYFGRDGMALRAKLSLTITEQNLAYEALEQGAGARQDTTATPPGAPAGGTPGSSGTANPVRAALAREGESVQQLLSRLDQDPAAWRSAMNGLTGPLALAAGAQVQLGASLSVSAGIGVSAGFGAGISTGASAGLGVTAGAGAALGLSTGAGLAAGASAGVGFGAGAGAGLVAGAGGQAGLFAGADASAGAFAGVSAVAAAGFALSAGGGQARSSDRIIGARVDAAVAAARGSFAVPATGGARPASAGISAGFSAGYPAGPAGGGQPPDPRATSYAQGIPLSHRADVVTVTGSVVDGTVVVGARTATVPPGGLAPWQRLPDPPRRRP
ncbi:hypothetical protein R8Z50_12985 [Longispora sp. K20-0274]|uniref:CIS tube protein n=1 Tax=Longispora sp. K20-0274 TaxID=3088255 RepID=UPI00399ACAB2